MTPKMHLLVSRDILRPFLTYGLLTKEHIVVTNAHALVAHKTASLFDQDFIDSIPEGKGMLIPEATLKEMNKNKITYTLCAEDVPTMEFVFKGAVYNHQLKINGVEITFPQWEAVLSKSFDEPLGDVLGINPTLLDKTRQAINPDCDIVHLRSSGKKRAIGVFDPTDTYSGCRAIIMPTLTNNQ